MAPTANVVNMEVCICTPQWKLRVIWIVTNLFIEIFIVMCLLDILYLQHFKLKALLFLGLIKNVW